MLPKTKWLLRNLKQYTPFTITFHKVNIIILNKDRIIPLHLPRNDVFYIQCVLNKLNKKKNSINKILQILPKMIK